jgi:hypothetical protein
MGPLVTHVCFDRSAAFGPHFCCIKTRIRPPFTLYSWPIHDLYSLTNFGLWPMTLESRYVGMGRLTVKEGALCTGCSVPSEESITTRSI